MHDLRARGCVRIIVAKRLKVQRLGFTVFELLTVIAIIAVLISLTIPAIQKVRAAAERVRCANQLRQIGLAFIRCHDDRDKSPPGTVGIQPKYDFPYMTWLTRLLPYVEQEARWQQVVEDYRTQRNPFRPIPHKNLAAPITLFACPADPRGPGPHSTHRNRMVGTTSYAGVLGTDHVKNDGALFLGSAIRLSNIPDGTSNTLLIGERPPSTDFWYGWWYAGVGMEGSGAPDFLLGVREVRTNARFTQNCSVGPFHFQPGRLTEQCDAFHFWSLHPGGAHFAMCDGSVHFLSYSADRILPALATRAGGEAVELP